MDLFPPTQFHTTSLLWMANIAKESDTTIHPSNYLAKDGQLKIGKKGTKKLIKSIFLDIISGNVSSNIFKKVSSGA